MSVTQNDIEELLKLIIIAEKAARMASWNDPTEQEDYQARLEKEYQRGSFAIARRTVHLLARNLENKK